MKTANIDRFLCVVLHLRKSVKSTNALAHLLMVHRWEIVMRKKISAKQLAKLMKTNPNRTRDIIGEMERLGFVHTEKRFHKGNINIFMALTEKGRAVLEGFKA